MPLHPFSFICQVNQLNYISGTFKRPRHILRFLGLVHSLLHPGHWSHYQRRCVRNRSCGYRCLSVLYVCQIRIIVAGHFQSLRYCFCCARFIASTGIWHNYASVGVPRWCRKAIDLVFGNLAAYRTFLLSHVLWHGHTTGTISGDD